MNLRGIGYGRPGKTETPRVPKFTVEDFEDLRRILREAPIQIGDQSISQRGFTAFVLIFMLAAFIFAMCFLP
jgi:hypothetical protein